MGSAKSLANAFIFLKNKISILEVNIDAPSCLGNEVNGIAIHYTTTCHVHYIICYHQTHCSEVADPLQRWANLTVGMYREVASSVAKQTTAEKII